MITTSPLLSECLVYVACGAACLFPLISLNIRLALRFGFIDWPKARGVADEQIPIVGHSLIALSVVMVFGLMAYYSLSPWFLTTALIMGVMGYFDDRRPLSALDKIFFQLFCVVSVVCLDPGIHEAITVRYGVGGLVWTIVFMVGLINAINFIDGIDGLAGVVIFGGAAGFVLLARHAPQLYPYFIYASLLMGMLLPFLYFNVVRRRGFLGNVGSYFFSYVLAVMHASIPIDSAGPVSRLALSGLCFLVPLADAGMVILVRMLTARSPFHADKGHLHHRLVQSNLPLRYILPCFAWIEASGVVIACLLAGCGPQSGMLPTVICISLAATVAMLILLVEQTSRRRIQSYFQRLDAGEPVYFVKYLLNTGSEKALTLTTLRRIEARVSAEIRVTDLCFTEAPNTLFVTLRSSPEPLKGISGRIDAILQQEKLSARVVVEQGEFVKMARTGSRPVASGGSAARRRA